MVDDIGIPLREFAKGKTQPQVAALIGVSQGAVSQMLSSDRDIRVRTLSNGRVQAVEIRPVGRRANQAA